MPRSNSAYKPPKKICCFFFNSAAILSLILFISLFSVLLVTAFKPLYYLDIKRLNISKSSGWDPVLIKENYNYIIDYLSNSKSGSFTLPGMNSSEHGRIHFEEVKVLYSALGIICVISGIFALFSTLRPKQYRKKVRKISGISLIILPVFLGILFLANFDKYFNIFHKIVFKNDFWLFNPNTDPVIRILPEEFFMHCAILISALMLFSGLILIYTSKQKQVRKANLKTNRI